MALLTRSMGWTAAEVEVFLVGLRQELNDKSIHILDHAHVVYGRKPFPPEHPQLHKGVGFSTWSRHAPSTQDWSSGAWSA
jgi:hypothetical protein